MYPESERDFTSVGEAILNPILLKCEITEDTDCQYMLEATLSGADPRSVEVTNGKIIVAMPNKTASGPDFFRVWETKKNIKGNIDIKAYHISYDLNKWMVKPWSDAVDATEAFKRLSRPPVFYIHHSKKYTINLEGKDAYYYNYMMYQDSAHTTLLYCNIGEYYYDLTLGDVYKFAGHYGYFNPNTDRMYYDAQYQRLIPDSELTVGDLYYDVNRSTCYCYEGPESWYETYWVSRTNPDGMWEYVSPSEIQGDVNLVLGATRENYRFEMHVMDTAPELYVQNPDILTARGLLCGSNGQSKSYVQGFGGCLKFHQWDIYWYQSRGRAEPVAELRYGRNMKSGNIERSYDTAYSGIFPYYRKSVDNGTVTHFIGDEESGKGIQESAVIPIVQGEGVDYSKVYLYDCTNEFDGAPSDAQLREQAYKFIAENHLDSSRFIGTVTVDADLVDINAIDDLQLYDNIRVINPDWFKYGYKINGVYWSIKNIHTGYAQSTAPGVWTFYTDQAHTTLAAPSKGDLYINLHDTDNQYVYHCYDDSPGGRWNQQDSAPYLSSYGSVCKIKSITYDALLDRYTKVTLTQSDEKTTNLGGVIAACLSASNSQLNAKSAAAIVKSLSGVQYGYYLYNKFWTTPVGGGYYYNGQMFADAAHTTVIIPTVSGYYFDLTSNADLYYYSTTEATWTKADTSAIILGGEANRLYVDNTTKIFYQFINDSYSALGNVSGMVFGYYYNGSFFYDSNHTSLITPDASKVYVDLTSGSTNMYRYSGTAYVAIGASVTIDPNGGLVNDTNGLKINLATSHVLRINNQGKLYLDYNSDYFKVSNTGTSRYYLDLVLDSRSLGWEQDYGLGVKLKQNGGIIFDGTYGLKLDTSSLVTSIGEKTGAIGLGTGLTIEQVGTTGVWRIKVNTSTIVSFTDLYNLRYMADPNASQYGYYHSFNEEGSKQFEWVSAIPASGINYGNGLTSNAGQLVVDTDVIQTKISANTYAAYDHNHDGRYYTETEVNTLLNSKLNIPNLSGSGATQPVYWNNTTKQFYRADPYPTTLPASDVYSWAKAASKPSYSWNEIGSKPTFHTVATSGSYNDLSNKPTIPTVNNAALKFYGNSTQVASFSANASAPADLYIKSGTGISIATDSGEITINCTVTDTDTHRPIKVNGEQKLGNNSTPLDICAGDNITLSYNATTNKLWIASTGGGSLPTPEGANRILISQDNGSGTEYEWVQETKANLLSGLMPKSGGSFTGVVKFNPGDGNCIVFDANTTFTINQNGGITLIGTNGSANWIGLRTADTQIRGSQARPKYYQGNNYRGELALLSDTISYSKEGIHEFENTENRADGVIATFRSSGTGSVSSFIGLGNGSRVYGYYGLTSGGKPVFREYSVGTEHNLATELWVSENFIPWSCLIEGTKIKMFDGTEKNIEDVEPGDSILTYDVDKHVNIEGVVIGSFCTGKADDYKAYIFEDGKYAEFYGEHSVWNVEVECPKKISRWTLGEHGIAEELTNPSLVSVDEIHHPIFKRHYVLVTNNNLYYANGILMGHWSAFKYNIISNRMSDSNFPTSLMEQYKTEAEWNERRNEFPISPDILSKSSTVLANLRSLTKQSDDLKEALNQSDYTVTKVAEAFFGKLKAIKLWTIGNLKDAFEAIKDFDYTDRDTMRKQVEALKPQIEAAQAEYDAIRKEHIKGMSRLRIFFRRSSRAGNQNVAQIKEWANSLKGENET